MLDFRIETFLCVCKHMNYTKAAEELKMTQPGVSQHIKYLEEYYKDKLFLYSNKKLVLTQAGIYLKDAMLSIKHDNAHLKNMIREHKIGANLIKFGATLTIGEFYLPLRIASYMNRNTGTQIEFAIDNTKELLSLLEEGKIDFAMVEGYFEKHGYDYMTISYEKYVLVCGKNYPLKDGIDLKELFSHHLIVREDGSGTKEILERYLFEKGHSLDDFSGISAINSIHLIKQLVEQGCGISFMYEIAVKKEIEEGKLQIINIKDFNLYHEFNYIWRKNSVFEKYYQDIFLDFMG